ncbi:hypothetical protein ACTXNC_01520 [Psychrobacter celer]|uniref:hypothetical protein n=1 Tax=Psychrobacter celer TaxID=306572 RepID=UPI003FD62BA9
MSLVDLIKKEDDEYISVNAFIKLVSNHTKDSNDLVIEYIGKFCLSDRHDNINVYIKNSGNGYTSELYITHLISKPGKTDSHRFYTMSELEKNDEFLKSYFLKDEIFNASFIKSLNLNPNSYKKPFIDVEVIDNPIDRDLDQNDQNYISALKYVNDLGKGIGSGKPLKLALEYLVKNISFSEVELYLYDVKEEKYFLVSQTDSLDYITSIELLEGICHSLDGSQWGINFSDTALKPFKYFYFEYSELPELPDLRSSGDDTAVPKKSNQSSRRLPPPNLLERDKTGTPEVGHAKPKTYEQLVKDLATANNRIRQQDIDINRLSDQLNEQENKPIEDKELPYNSQMGVARMLHTILTMHKYDLSATKGKTNSLIERASQSNGTPVTRNFIAQWIDLANQAKSDSTK